MLKKIKVLLLLTSSHLHHRKEVRLTFLPETDSSADLALGRTTLIVLVGEACAECEPWTGRVGLLVGLVGGGGASIPPVAYPGEGIAIWVIWVGGLQVPLPPSCRQKVGDPKKWNPAHSSGQQNNIAMWTCSIGAHSSNTW